MRSPFVNYRRVWTFLIQISLLVEVSNAVQDYWDPDFGSPGVKGNGVTAITSVGDRLLVGGYFSEIGGVRATNIALWEGGKWSVLGDGLGVFDPHLSGVSSVNVIRVIGDEIYAGGTFTNSGPTPLSNMARWNGSAWVTLGSGVERSEAPSVAVLDIAGRSDRDIYVGGNFTIAGGVSVNRIAHWDGESWKPLSTGVKQAAPMPFVHALAIGDSNLYVGGAFTSAGGVAATNVAKWSGSRWEHMGDAILGPEVYALCINSGGTLHAGGRFGVSSWDGSAWRLIGEIAGKGFTSVLSIASRSEGLVVGGAFSRVAGVVATNIAQWVGGKWAPLGNGLHPNWVTAVTACPAEVVVGGLFNFAGERPSTNIARWHVPETLKLQSSSFQMHISWPAPDTNFVLEATSSLSSPGWSRIQQEPQIKEYRWTVTNAITAADRYFRLRSPDPR